MLTIKQSYSYVNYKIKNLAGGWNTVGAQRIVCGMNEWMTSYSLSWTFTFFIFCLCCYLCPQSVISPTLIPDLKSLILHSYTTITTLIFLEHGFHLVIPQVKSYPQELQVAKLLKASEALALSLCLSRFMSQDTVQQGLWFIHVSPAPLFQEPSPHWDCPLSQYLIHYNPWQLLFSNF